MQRYIFPATYTIVNVIFLVTFNYFNAFSLGKGHFFAPSRLYNGPAYAQSRYATDLSRGRSGLKSCSAPVFHQFGG
jgi:hypothetical protein